MRNLLFVLIGLFIFVGCSKSADEEKEEELPKLPKLMEQFDISPNDTAGLRIFGIASGNRDTMAMALLGNKNGKLWVQSLKHVGVDEFEKKYNFIVDANFNDRVEIDLGYGEKEVVGANYIDWNVDKLDPIRDVMDIYYISFHDKEHFVIAKTIGYWAWVICENEIHEKQIHYRDVIASGYIGMYDNSYYVCDETGEPLYEYKDEFKNYTFINLYEYITYSDYSITRQNGETGKIIWETQFEKMGQVIDGHEPKIEHSIQLTNNSISCTFNITNYDSSKETKNFNVNIETGEVTKL